MSQYTEEYEAHGMPVSVTKYEPEDWELAEVQEYEKRDNEMRNNLAIALNNTLAVKFQIENLDNPMIPYQTRIELINKLLESTIKSIQEAQELHDIE
ncbi:MAG: hypothetical protein HEQ13_27715 [Dolichospermum sp. DEX189]|jgi:hypothetical protein|uniref:Uncharacterized protein n=1 Tax=Aphanizomenon flos-aquae FACHB-1040 TaxID=2692887 RepID=A0ABR8BVK4_APHFL|nr:MULTISPECIES: hypothetical protein [Nostocales]ALB43772.1 hypothetical protein AA650_25820 [Anabaena sp. WA102]MBD2278933.1 hypothetical protein [Aphanizomenon flos-aquae FACHB-1040]MBO1072894.1 hypothetical protein [Dolichospermum sp. DEX189]MTJ22061.1 hypothetical protein [Dolichospermum sp. UHCC 0352]